MKKKEKNNTIIYIYFKTDYKPEAKKQREAKKKKKRTDYGGLKPQYKAEEITEGGEDNRE